MKKNILTALLLGCLCISCIGCGNTKQKPDVQPSTSSSIQEPDRHVEITTYNGRDIAKIIQHLTRFPEKSEDLKKLDIFVPTMAVTFNREILDNFLSMVEKGQTGYLDLATFTVEGYSIPTYIQYDGKDFYCVEYTERDYYSPDRDLYWSKKYKYLSLVKIPNNLYESLDLSDMSTGFVEFVPSNKKNLTYEDFEKLKESYYSFKISPFHSFKEFKSHVIDSE